MEKLLCCGLYTEHCSSFTAFIKNIKSLIASVKDHTYLQE